MRTPAQAGTKPIGTQDLMQKSRMYMRLSIEIQRQPDLVCRLHSDKVAKKGAAKSGGEPYSEAEHGKLELAGAACAQRGLRTWAHAWG